MYYILHGDDELGRSEWLDKLRARLAKQMDPAVAELNTSFIDGRTATMGQLHGVCDAIPFFGNGRLVIVRGLLGRLSSQRKAQAQEAAVTEEPGWKRAFVDELIEYLPSLPETTVLVFVESDSLLSTHPILRLAMSAGERERRRVREFKSPKERELPGWIQQRAQSKGGRFDPMAAMLLAGLAGDDLRLVDLEIEKLQLYADGRPVTASDVEVLVSRARETDVFALVDCLGRRQTDAALKLLHGLLDDGEAPLYILTMLVRQIRLLVQVSELQLQGLENREIADRLRVQPWLAGRLLAQATNFSMTQLMTAYERLADTDWAVKTGQMEELLALDLLVVALTERIANSR